MKKLLLASCAIAGLGLAGCADVTAFENWVTSPLTQATFATLDRQAVVFICNVSAVSGIAGAAEAAANAGLSMQWTNGKVYAVSSIACTGLGALVAGTAVVPAGTMVLQ